jgi:integrase
MGELKLRGRIWWVRYYRNGRRHEESARTAKKTEAERLLRLREGDVAKGLPISPKIGRLTFDEAAADVIADYVVNGKRSLRDVRMRIDRHLTPFFGGRRMSAITTADVRSYIMSRQQAVRVVGKGETAREVRPSNGEINRELTALKRAFSLAVQGGKLLAKPHVPMLREDNVRSGFFEPEQLVAVLQHLPEHVRPVIEFAHVTGWRIPSEVLPLQWRQVDFAAGEVRLDPGTTKNAEGRVFPFTGALRTLLERQRDYRDSLAKEAGKISPFVFSKRGAEILTIRWAWKKACREAGCPGRIPHDLRRTAVRNLVRAAVPEAVAMRLTGHKTRSVFERYNIVSATDLRSAARALEASMRQQPLATRESS